MRLGTRLLLPLSAVVALVMLLYGLWALSQRQSTLAAQARSETRAYATALGFALRDAFRDPELGDVQDIIDGISREPTVYGVVVYGPGGELLFVSDPLQAIDPAPASLLSGVLRDGHGTQVEREIDGQAVYSVVLPVLRPDGGIAGAFEVAQPLAFVEAEIRRTGQRFLLNTLTLLLALTAVIQMLVRRLVSEPLDRLVAGARALGRGDLSHRIEQAGGGELAVVAAEFNRMADRLEGARAELLRRTDERVSLERKLRESEKMAAVGKLAAGLAHEIGAPLQVIRGRAELLLQKEPSDQTRVRNLEIIAKQIGRITDIVRNLLEFARRREVAAQPVELGGVLDGVVELIDVDAHRAGVDLVREGEVAWAVADPELLHRVFLNLSLNALQALSSFDGAERRMVLRTRASEGNEGQSVLAEIEDSGPGVPADMRRSIFEPFFTTKEAADGTGLGLALAQRLVEEMGGQLECLDPPMGGPGESPAGACFRVTLPAAGGPHA